MAAASIRCVQAALVVEKHVSKPFVTYSSHMVLAPPTLHVMHTCKGAPAVEHAELILCVVRNANKGFLLIQVGDE